MAADKVQGEDEKRFHRGERVGDGFDSQQGTLRIGRLVFNRGMKRFLLILIASSIPSFAELPVMSDKTEWLGYFVGWEGKSSDFGIGSDGASLIHPKERGKRAGHKEIKVRYVVEEEVKGKWVRRKIIEEDGLSSETEKGLDPKKPVAFKMTVTGGTVVEWTHAPSRGKFAVMPKIVEKTTENKIRVGIEFSLPRLYRFDTMPEERELKKKVGGDYVRGTRLKDRKKVKVKFSDLEDDITSEEFLGDGASAVEIESEPLTGTLVIENGSEKSGRIDIDTNGALYNSFKVLWMADSEKLGERDTYVTFEVE